MKKILIAGVVMTLLVLARCIATVARELYYGRDAWLDVVLQDRWVYVGMAAVVLVCATAIVTLIQNRKR